MNSREEQRKIVVIGAGLAGLACAFRLVSGGHPVVVVEAGAEPGGRARTLDVAGRPGDRGFQSIFTAYREASRFMADIGMRDRDLVRFDRGAVLHDGIQWQRMGLSPRALGRFTAFTRADVARLGRLAAEVGAGSGAGLLEGDAQDQTTEEYLRTRGFSGGAIEGFFRPLFGVITLDRQLRSDAGYFRFLMHMLVRGSAAIPVEGHGMIADWASAAIRQRGGAIRVGAPVRAIRVGADGRADAVVLEDGEVLPASHVVVATEAPAARGLLQDLDPGAAARLAVEARGVTTLVYELARSFHSGRTIVLNSAPGDGRPRVDLVCQESNLMRPGAGAPHVLLVTSVHDDAGAPDISALEGEMARVAGRWSPGYDWGRHARLADAVVHSFGQFAVTPGVRRDLPGPRTAVPNVMLAGDVTHHPSIEGAISSGNIAADIVSELAG